MKKVEAQEIAPDKSRVLLEYIEQFMSCDNLTGTILIDSDKDPKTKESMCYMEIMLNDGFERHLKTDITAQQSDVFSKQVLLDLAERYACDKDVIITRFYSVKSMERPMHGINIMNHNGSCITLNFLCRGLEFDKVIESYSMKLIDEENNVQRKRNI